MGLPLVISKMLNEISNIDPFTIEHDKYMNYIILKILT